MSARNRLANALGYQAAWWACVLGVAWDRPYLGPVLMAAYLTLHLLTVPDARAELRLVAIGAAMGTVIDSLLGLAGLVRYHGGYPLVGWLAPLWITALWAGFAATLLHSLAFLRGRRWLAALFGALGGPLSFYGGAQLGVLSLGPSPGLALVVLALGWSIAIPALYAFAAWSERERARSRRLALQTDRRPRAATAPARLPLRPTSDAGSARLSQS